MKLLLSLCMILEDKLHEISKLRIGNKFKILGICETFENFDDELTLLDTPAINREIEVVTFYFTYPSGKIDTEEVEFDLIDDVYFYSLEQEN